MTRILIKQKEVPFAIYIKNFYGRRILRIFPPYFLYLFLILVLMLFGVVPKNLLNQLIIAATFTYDFYHASEFFSQTNFFNHLWALSVVVQYYIFWPWIIYGCPKRHLKRLMLFLIIAGPVIRALTFCFWGSVPYGIWMRVLVVYLLPTSYIDAFAMGSLLSIVSFKGSKRWFFVLLFFTLIMGLVNSGSESYFRTLGYPLFLPLYYQFIWGYSLLNYTIAFLIMCIAKRNFMPFFFENRIVSYLGEISYGIYIFHFPFYLLYPQFLFPTILVFIIIASAASYHFLELPLNRRKEYLFPYP